MKTPGSGRKKGTTNKVTLDIRTASQQHGPACIAALVKIVKESYDDKTRIAAIKELLDRGYGKSIQPITGGTDDDPPVRIQIIEPRASSERP